MIYYLKGYVTEVNDSQVVLEINGIGYEIFCKNASQFFVSKEKEAKFYIFEHIQENAHTLYGFSKKEDLEMLKVLISVKGIGPKMGLKILNSADIGLLIRAIEQENPKVFPQVKGVGDKAKKRLITELKGKIPEHLVKKATTDSRGTEQDIITSEAHEALISLGLTQAEALNAIEKAPADIKSTGELVKWGLRNR